MWVASLRGTEEKAFCLLAFTMLSQLSGQAHLPCLYLLSSLSTLLLLVPLLLLLSFLGMSEPRLFKLSESPSGLQYQPHPASWAEQGLGSQPLQSFFDQPPYHVGQSNESSLCDACIRSVLFFQKDLTNRGGNGINSHLGLRKHSEYGCSPLMCQLQIESFLHRKDHFPPFVWGVSGHWHSHMDLRYAHLKIHYHKRLWFHFQHGLLWPRARKFLSAQL